MRSRAGREQGFGVLETVFVVALAGVLLAAATPIWQRYLSSRRLDIAVETLVSDMRVAQQRAVEERQPYAVTFHAAATPPHWHLVRAGTEITTVNLDRGGLRGVRIFSPPAPQNPTFSPSGTATAGVVVLRNVYGKRVQVNVQTGTGRVSAVALP